MSATLDEHLDYLSLKGRGEAFAKALGKVVNPGDVVADLGCGVGVLGLQALNAGAGRVYGLDYSDAIEIAREAVAKAGHAENYHCIRESTFRCALPEKVDVIICDHVGYFGFDYGIIEMIEDARRRFLKQGGTIVPRRIKLMLAGATSPQCRSQATGWKRDPVPQEYHWVHEYSINTKHRHSFKPDEICTDPVELGIVDLTADSPASFAFDAQITANRDCTFDGLACWFDCELAEGVWMTNSPLSEQRINRPNAFLACREPFAVKAGEVVGVKVKIRHDVTTIAWTITPPNGGQKQKLSTWNSTILAPVDLAPKPDGPLNLNPLGKARHIVLGLIDSHRTARDIEDAVVDQHPDLFPTEVEIRRFVRRELATGTQG